MNRELRRQLRQVFQDHAIDGWTGDALALGEAEFLDALEEIFKTKQLADGMECK